MIWLKLNQTKKSPFYRFEKIVMVGLKVSWFGSVQVSKVVNGLVSNKFGFGPLEPNQTVADCATHLPMVLTIFIKSFSHNIMKERRILSYKALYPFTLSRFQPHNLIITL